jgi:hypothetical protein
MKRSRITILVGNILLLITYGGYLHAQSLQGDEPVEVELFHPRIGGVYTVQPERSFRDQAGSYGMRSGRAFVDVPLFERVSGVDLARDYSVLLLQASASASYPEFSIMNRQHKLYGSALGLTYGILTSDRSLYAMTLSASIAEDEVTISNSQARIFGLVIGSSKLTNDCSLIYGLGYTYLFDQDRLLPIAGVQWRIAPQWFLRAILPFAVRVNYHISSEWSSGLGMTVAGSRFRYSGDQWNLGANDEVSLRLSEIQLGVNVNWKPRQDMLLKSTVGMVVARRLDVLNGANELFTARVQPSPSLSISLQFILWKQPFTSDED